MTNFSSPLKWVVRYKWAVATRFDFTADRVTKSIEESLSRLQLSHVDLL